MAPLSPLKPEALYRRTDPALFEASTTADLPDAPDFIGQDRAVKAIEFGVSMSRQGYNVFALGPSGAGKFSLVRRYVERRAAGESIPSDWCYVNNFDQPYMPRALRLPAGQGKVLRGDMQRLIEDLRTALASAFESDEYQTRRQSLEVEIQDRQQESLQQLQEQARARGLALLRTPAGLAFAPLKDGAVIAPEEFEKLPAEEQERVKTEVQALQEQLQKLLALAPRWEREFRDRKRELDQEVAGVVLVNLMDDLYEKYAKLEAVVEFLHAVQKDVSEHLADFLGDSERPDGPRPPVLPDGSAATPLLRRYQVNVLVDASENQGSPVIHESNPSYLNLVGRVEQMAHMGALITDFTLIKPGVLHRANGGYLILDALKVLAGPYAWEGLKRALQFRQIRIESPGQMLSMTNTVSLEPEPIPLDVKVVLLGDPLLYYQLANLDPDFNELFKVAADFGDEFARTPEAERLYAQLIATIARREALRPFDGGAICRIIEQSARMAGDAERLTIRMQPVVDLMEEADHWAAESGVDVVGAAHVQQGIDAQIYRSDRVRSLMQDEILRRTIFIDTDGVVVGQINGLSVLQLGTFAFGHTSRITATIRMGEGEVLNIEREVEMSGPLHAKGVLILSSFLSARYALDKPLSLSASLVFEQSYGGVEGDSASSTELYALLSAIADAPIKQSLAVTGSVNQRGEVQAIGGVNEKIEGFFDLCNARGLTGEQGVLIPVANVKHLMLRQDVVEAAAAGKFHIFPVNTIDEGIEILTGIAAGVRGRNGRYPQGTINQRVEARLRLLAKKRAEYDKGPAERRRSRQASADGDEKGGDEDE
ncbi:MAG: Lon protease family protein [Caldilineaceae bacterium]|nr:Lon protease family protein [Caldilineaceae bacterium]